MLLVAGTMILSLYVGNRGNQTRHHPSEDELTGRYTSDSNIGLHSHRASCFAHAVFYPSIGRYGWRSS